MAQQWDMKTFMKGASILTISAIIVKLLGAVYRVPFQNLVGDKGFYIYQQVYPFIGIFIVWTSYGFAVAVSKLLAGSTSRGEAKAMMRVAFTYLLLLSVVFFALLTIFAPFFARSMGDVELVPLLRAGAYIVLLMPALAVLKGSFQSEGRMVPVAVSSVGEQAFRVTVILIGTWIAVRSGASLYVAGEVAMWGAVVGESAGVVILALYFRNTFKGPLEKVDTWRVVKELTVVSLGVSASSLILLLFQLVDSFTVYNILLSNGLAAETAMVMKGVYDRGQPLVQMGILIASTLALAIVPLIAHHSAKKAGRGALPFIRLTFRTAFLFGWAAAAGLALVLPYVNEMLFETRDGSVALIVFSLQIFWLSLILPLTAMLQGAGKVKVPTLLLIGGLVIKVFANQLLVPLWNVTGAAIAGNIGFAAITFGLLLYFKTVWPIRLAPARFYGWAVGATTLMMAVVFPWMLIADGFLFDKFPGRVEATLIALTSVSAGAAVFLFVIMKSRIMAEKEWFLLPFGKRLATLQLRLTKEKVNDVHQLTIIGLGAGDLDQLALGTYRKLKEATCIVARTDQHPAVAELRAEGIVLTSFDEIYEKHDAFEHVYDEIVDQLLIMCAQQPVTYVVPGHPLVAERTVQLLVEKEHEGLIQMEIAGGNSFLDPIFAALRIDPIEGFQLLDGTDMKRDDVHMKQHILIGQVYDAFVASEVKLSLMEKYAYDHPVTVVTAAGSTGEQLMTVPLFELDRVTEINNLTTVYVPPVVEREARLKDWSTFREIIAALRAPGGCPWDREQTHVTLKRYLIEEAHELLEAIDNEDDDAVIEELGDVLLQVFLHAQVGEDDGYFAMEDVLQSVGSKMIRRHPHVFGDKNVKDSEEVLQNWQDIKQQEKPLAESLLEGQERPSSSLLTSLNYQKEAAKVGFDWPTIEGAFEKFDEEWVEFRKELEDGTKYSQMDELGDVLFTIVNIARFLKLSPEEAMVHANQKFNRRFSFVEKSVKNGHGKFTDYTLDELEEFWKLAKKGEDNHETR